MTQHEFQAQINRLAETFGKNHYGNERVRLLWSDVQDYSGDWLKRVVDAMITGHRQAPLPSDFGEAISYERERQWRREKEANEKDAKAFWQGTYQPDEVRFITGAIRRRISGGMPDTEWESFMSALNGAAVRASI